MRALIFLVLPILASAYSNTKMLCLVNKQRVKYGLSTLGLSADLTNSAQQHSNDQARMKKMSHDGSNGSDPGTRIQQYGYEWHACAENVAYGYPGAESKVMKAWMKSPGHRANILGPYTHFGSAVAYTGKTPYYTQDFGDNNDGGNFPECPEDDDGSTDDSSEDDSGDSDDSDDGGSMDIIEPMLSGGGGWQHGGRRQRQSVVWTTAPQTTTFTIGFGGGRGRGGRHGRHGKRH